MSSIAESIWIQNLTWQDFEQYVVDIEHPTVIVPIGSTEQHGPHLPLGVDAYQAKDIAEGIAKRTNAIAAPPLWYGDAEHHMAFSGTIALSSDTVTSILKDIYTSLAEHGIENILTVNGHRLANLPTIAIASKQIKEEYPRVFFGTIDPVRIGVRAHQELREGDREDGMHGGEFETSFIMHKHPELVKETEFIEENHENWTRFTSNDFVGLDDTVLTANSSHDWNVDDLGHHGDPTKASAEKGEKLYESIVDNAVEFISDLHAHRSNENASHSAQSTKDY